MDKNFSIFVLHSECLSLGSGILCEVLHFEKWRVCGHYEWICLLRWFYNLMCKQTLCSILMIVFLRVVAPRSLVPEHLQEFFHPDIIVWLRKTKSAEGPPVQLCFWAATHQKQDRVQGRRGCSGWHWLHWRSPLLILQSDWIVLNLFIVLNKSAS